MPKRIPKYGVSEFVQFVGLRKLNTSEQRTVSQLSTKYCEKLQRLADNVRGLTVHVKTYEKEGARKKYSIHVRVKSPTRAIIESCRGHDFDLRRALHKAFTDLIEQAKHYWRKDTTRKKAYE